MELIFVIVFHIQILDTGDIQLGEKERQHQMDEKFKEIAHIVAEKTVNPETNRPYTTAMIEKAIREYLHYSVHPTRSTKQQALEVIKLLKQKLPISRAQMKIALIIPVKEAKLMKDRLLSLMASVSNEHWNQNTWEVTGLIDPGHYRQIDELILRETKGKAFLDILSLKEIEEGDEKL
jgi:ribosome maturation protein SDO1